MRWALRIAALLTWICVALFAFLVLRPSRSQTIVTGGNRKVFPAYVNPCTLPFSDSFSGTGALSSCWYAYGADTAVLSSGSAVPNTANLFGFQALAFATVPTQTATVSVNWLSNPARSGPMVRANATTGNGNGYLWQVGSGNLDIVHSGIVVLATLGACPAVSSGDLAQLSISGSTLTCTDLTTWASATYTDTANTYPTGRPGFVIDGTSESTVSAGPFTATSP